MQVSKFDLPDWVRWVAQDADGVWWGYECEPLLHDHGWYENEVGRNYRIVALKLNPDWQTTLRKIKK